MGSNFPTANDSFAAPSSPSTTTLASGGDSTRNHPQSHQDLGDAIVALETNVPLLGHDHSGTGSRATNKLAQANTHQTPDTDSATSSLHHTIGTGGTQAAAGNHTHSRYELQMWGTNNQSATHQYYASCSFTASFAINPFTDSPAQGNWAALEDPYNLFTAGGVSGPYCFFTIPFSGRWRVFGNFAASPYTSSSSATLAGKILKNGVVTANNSIESNSVAASNSVNGSSEVWLKMSRPVPLLTGDKIYSSLWSNVGLTITSGFFNVPTMFGIEWMGQT